MKLAIPRLKKRIQQVEEFQPEAVRSTSEASAVITPLQASIDDALTRTFGSETIEYRRYSAAKDLRWPINVMYETPVHEIVESLKRCKARAISLLNEAVLSLEEQIEEAGATSDPEAPPDRQVTKDTRRVFIVHGHDVAARESLSRFMERCGFEPIVLHEKANQGRTVIEKFEANADVGFCVVLLTPDDACTGEGGVRRHRARQNVILELGYFIGRLGRERVCALKSGDLELPSDILGVV